MKITCPDCDTSYEIKAELVGAEGRSVKCARCGNRWFISPRKETLVDAKPAAKPKATAAAAEPEDEDDDWGIEPPKKAKAEKPKDDDWASAIDGDESDPDAWSDQEKESDERARAEARAREAAAARADADADDADAFAFEADAADDAATGKSSAQAFARGNAAQADTEGDGDGEDGQEDGDSGAAARRTIDIESLAKRKKIKVNPNKMKKRRDWSKLRRYVNAQNLRRAGGIMILLLSLGTGAWLFFNRALVVKQAPDLASLFEVIGYEVNLRGLEFRDLRTFREIEGGAAVLVVEGTIQNIGEAPVAVPAVRLALRGEDQQEIYAWTLVPRAVSLDALASTRFRTRLADPPETAADIQVRFIDRSRQQATLQNQ
jgi:predicted Zn finger-like uncharacterized protein